MGKKVHLFMMLGHAGSGKSYFARQLADEKGLVRLNGDTLRIDMYGSVKELNRYKAFDTSLSKEKIFKAIDYAAKQVLSAGCSVIYDANNNKQSVRKQIEEFVIECGAVPIVVWVQTSVDIAIQRVQDRESTAEQRKWNESQARETIERHIANTDEPATDENVIKIDGTLQFNDQLASFEEQLGLL